MRVFFCGASNREATVLADRFSDTDIRIEHISGDVARYGMRDLSEQVIGIMPVVVADGPDCRNLVTSLRRISAHIPLMVLQGGVYTSIPEHLLDAGADDVVKSERRVEEIAARLRAICRRRPTPEHETAEIRVGPLRIDPATDRILIRDDEMDFTRTERNILRVLAFAAPSPVPRQAIYDALYALSYDPPQPKAVDMHIFKLRKKLSRHGRGWEGLVETCAGRGYRIAEFSDVGIA